MSRLSDPRCHDDLLNYQLKRLVRLGGAPAIRLCEGQFGVARSEWRLVAALVEEGPRSPTELALRTGLEQARVSRLVTELIGKGLIERSERTEDHRRAVLTPTAKGSQLYEELFPKLAQINRRLMAVLDEGEAIVLEDLLDRLTRQAREIYEQGGGVDVRADRWRGSGHRPRP
jgi:DNA-binding MarR family transcriptional regulator